MVTIHTDPVCGMEVTPKTAAGRFDFRGVTYYFCSAGCKKTFEEDPGVDFALEPVNPGDDRHHRGSQRDRSAATHTSIYSQRGAEHRSG